MYEGELKAHTSVCKRVMEDLVKTSQEHDILSSPLMILDTAGSLMYEGIDE
jgi:hypothetical protein